MYLMECWLLTSPSASLVTVHLCMWLQHLLLSRWETSCLDSAELRGHYVKRFLNLLTNSVGCLDRVGDSKSSRTETGLKPEHGRKHIVIEAFSQCFRKSVWTDKNRKDERCLNDSDTLYFIFHWDYFCNRYLLNYSKKNHRMFHFSHFRFQASEKAECCFTVSYNNLKEEEIALFIFIPLCYGLQTPKLLLCFNRLT